MGGGLMQLVAYGAQDIYLTGNPQITFFKVVYRRHTNFSMELIQQTLQGSAGVSSTQSCIVSRNGDLIMDVWISQNSTSSVDGEIYDYIDNVELRIGGQLIDKHHGDWNAVWWNLTTPESKVNGLRNMFVGLSGATDAAESSNTASYFYYPLNFWFCKNPGLALPMIALQYHEVEFKITWGEASLAASGTSPEVWINYVYLDTDERRRFAQIAHEYLIEQVQRFTFAGNNSSFDLNINHPVKELIWVNDVASASTGATVEFGPIRCTANCNNAALNNCYETADATKCKLILNGNDRFQSKEMKYFKVCQPMKHHTRIPSVGKRFTVTRSFNLLLNAGILLHYCTKPVRVISVDISFEVAAAGTPTVTLEVDAGSSSISQIAGDSLSKEVTIGHKNRYTLDSATGDKNLFTTEVVCVPAGKHISLDCDGDVPAGGSTTLKNDTVSGIVTLELEELPLLIGGDKNDIANIYCYSFALKPEDHQPSGTCNFSRIDSAKLKFDDNVGGPSTTFKVFALNYNVLRIMSGMGGLAYSN